MELRRLQLKLTPGAWQKYNARKLDLAFLEFSKRVFDRDNHTCQFCGFQAGQYQEAIYLDQNYSNSKLENLITACCFCAQCFFVETIGIGSYGGGTLIYLPEIEQAELNALCHVMFCAISNGTNYKDTAEQIYRSLKFRSQSIEEVYGEGTSRPSVFGRLYLSLKGDALEKMQNVLVELRVLPSHTRFKKQIEAWAKAAIDEMP